MFTPKRKYIKPIIDLIPIEDEGLLQNASGGGEDGDGNIEDSDNGLGNDDAKHNHFDFHEEENDGHPFLFEF